MRAPPILQARSGDAAFLARLRGGAFDGRVHSAFRRAVNIACLSTGELYALVAAELDDGPDCLVVETGDFLAPGIAAGDRAFARDGGIAIADKALVGTAGARTWAMPRPAAAPGPGLLRRAEHLLRRHGRPGGFLEAPDASPAARVTARMLREESEALAAALAGGGEEVALHHARRLLGLGPGLTPSGDDFLTGFLAARSLRRGEDGFGRAVAAMARGATHAISHAAIAQAARGAARDRIARLVVALCADRDDDLHAALMGVLAIGSSSGTEIALGVIRGLGTTLGTTLDDGERDNGTHDGHQEEHLFRLGLADDRDRARECHSGRRAGGDRHGHRDEQGGAA